MKENYIPAFPLHFVKAHGNLEQGMTLRDYFAAKAMQGYIVGTEKPKPEFIARVAYEVADAMLKAR